MKLRKKLICGVTALMLTMSQTAFADTFYLAMSGTTNDPDAIGATVLMVDKGANTDALATEDILYINQCNIAPDGSYKIVLPFFTEGSYDFITNMDGYDISELQKDKVLYVSANGNDSAAGTADAPLKTLAKAYESIAELKEVVVSGTVAYADAPGSLTITGLSGAVLTLPSEISLKGDLTLSGVTLSGASTIFANGHHLTVSETTTSNSRLTVYGATNGTAYTGDTNLTLLGGLYTRIYGGGTADMTGNTHVILGGNANAGDGIDDQAANISPCYVYGGGSSGKVIGETNVTIQDNAVTKMVYGAGATAGATKTNVTIAGGKAMNVFGGSNGTAIDGCETNVTITGGLVESIFGGCEDYDMTNSHTHVNLLGGDVSRRVYSGCYNNITRSGLSIVAQTTCAVNGTTTITFGKNAKVNSKTELHSENQSDIGVHGGSRLRSNNANEKTTVIYLEDTYSSMNGQMGSQDLTASILGLKNNVTYTVKANAGGMVTNPNAAGTITVTPDKNYLAQIGSTYHEAGNIAISSGTTTVTFVKNFAIDSLDATTTDTGLTANVGLTANNVTNETKPHILVAIYDIDTDELVACKQVDTTTAMTSQTFDFTCDLVAGKTYDVKAMLWNAEVEPLTTAYRIQIQK